VQCLVNQASAGTGFVSGHRSMEHHMHSSRLPFRFALILPHNAILNEDLGSSSILSPRVVLGFVLRPSPILLPNVGGVVFHVWLAGFLPHLLHRIRARSGCR